MNKRYSCALLTAAFILPLFSQTAEARISYRKRDAYRPHISHSKTSFSMEAGVRRDNFDWNIASDTTGTSTPNILSELTWTDIQLYEVATHLRHVEPTNISWLPGGVLFDAKLTAGFVNSGENQDSDYNGDNRTLEFSRSNNESSGGYALSGKVAVGYQFDLGHEINYPSYTFLTLTPLIGYGWHTQEYEMTDGVQTIPAFGAFSGLNSTYTSTWSGPFLGLEAGIEGRKHMLTLRGEYHLLDFVGEGVWNLRGDFAQDPSFRDEAEGTGIELNLGYSYAIDTRYEFTIDLSHAQREATDGNSETFFSNGNVTEIKFNEVNDSTQSLRVGLQYMW